MRRSAAANAELALHLEVASTPKPGNVDRHRDLDGLRFEHFLAGGVGARPGLEAAESGAPVGEAFERAVAGMSEQTGGNTQFGCLLLLVPLAAAARGGRPPTREAAARVTDATTVDDAAGFYRAFEHVDVAVADPPDGWDALDVRHGSDAIPALRERDLTLADVMGNSDGDLNAAEWREGFPRAFRIADVIQRGEGPLPDRAARAFLDQLAREPDTLVATQHDRETAERVRERADELRGASEKAVEEWADDLVARDVNPGTTADLTCAGIFLALERGVTV